MISEKNEREDGSSSCSNSVIIRQCRYPTAIWRERPTFGVLVAQSLLPHVRKFYGTLAGRVHEPIATLRVKFSRCNDFCELFHVSRLDIDDIETLVLDVKVPQIYSQVIRADECLSITVDRDAVDVIGVCVGICSPWYRCNDSIMMCQSRKLQVGHTAEVVVRISDRTSSIRAASTRWCELRGEVVLGDDLERLFEHFPQLDRLVVG